VALSGRDGGATASRVDVHVNVPGGDTARIQEVHRTLLHILCELVEI
jgi:D-sedoheptulose 7-phosphate isomerase